MIVYALVGASGTGKSHHASLLAFENDIRTILDDGLLIHNHRVIAGRSAKRELTKIGAAKRALLTDPDHARALREKIKEFNPDKILLIGTSRRMVQRLSEILDIPQPDHYILIEDIVPKEVIRKALKARKDKNRHVVPLPTFAIKKDFPGYLIAPLYSIFARSGGSQKKITMERSIVRPIYSSLGNFSIAENVVINLVTYLCQDMPGISRVNKVKIKSDRLGVTMNVELTMFLQPHMRDSLAALQSMLKENIEYMTGLYLNQINVSASKLTLDLPDTKE
ncbi:MAG: hypothetical protein GX887_06495 [Firmicutes bacterium]|nr:hypothetical protein [Bacillota bacterium]